MLISVIVNTYNRPDALKMVLESLNRQHYKKFEVVVADDGSAQDTADMLAQLKGSLDYDLLHVWQDDQGFRVAKIRNRAVAASRGEYLIFLDGDLVPQPSYLMRHVQLREYGWALTTKVAYISERFTRMVLKENLPVYEFSKYAKIRHFIKRDINRFWRLFYFPMGWSREIKPGNWRKVRSCMGVWRKDFEQVNGFDERFTGWGREDSDFVMRLFHNGIRFKQEFFPLAVLHLWHPKSSRARAEANHALFEQRVREKTKRIADIHGYSKYCVPEHSQSMINRA